MVECVSSKIGCFPVRDKTASSWEDGVRRMLEENTDEITVLVSDRDSAVVGNAFRKRMKEKYGIDWCFLKSRSKAFLAETYIGHVKTALSVAMAANPKEKDWSKFLPAVVERFNDKLSPGTRMKRKSINKGNYLEALAQRYKVGDPEASFHGTHVSGESISPKRAKLLWKYAVGTRVRLSRRASHVKGERFEGFAKPSLKGSFGPTERVVVRRALRASGNSLVPVYELSGISGHFYEVELLQVG